MHLLLLLFVILTFSQLLNTKSQDCKLLSHVILCIAFPFSIFVDVNQRRPLSRLNMFKSC